MFAGKGKRVVQEGVTWQDEAEAGEREEVVWDETCAWCVEEQGIVARSGSHGICARHEQQVYQSYRTGGRRRRQ